MLYNTEKIKDYCTRIGHRLPEFHLKSFYFDEPKLYKGQKMVIDVNYYGPGSNVMVFYDHIDFKYLESKSNISNSNCFIVTTVMGDIDHPIVEDFRRYRDQVLLNTYLGRLFINTYYKIGPTLSNVIINNKLLFKFSRSFIIHIHRKFIKK